VCHDVLQGNCSMCQSCKPCVRQNCSCNTNKTWYPCGICRAPRKMFDVDIERRSLKDNKTPKFGTLYGATNKGSLCRSLECLLSPTIEHSSQEEACPHVDVDTVKLKKEEGCPMVSYCQESEKLEDKWKGVLVELVFCCLFLLLF
jgi:hypothetical protein